MARRRPDPVSLVSLVLVGLGIVLLARERTDPTPPGPAAGGPTSPTGGRPATPTPTERGELAEDAACRGASYLCSELAFRDRIRIQRWRDPAGPLVVHLPDPGLADRGHGQRLQRAAAAGVRAWNGHPFPILVDERGTRPAHVEVKWVRRLDGARLGVATVAWSPTGGLRVISLEIATELPWGAPMDPDQLRLVAAHEMGHALGLPHSDDSRDVMYPTNTATSLSVRDYRAVEALYGIEDGTEVVRSPRR